MSNRDTQFAGFAKLLLEDLLEVEEHFKHACKCPHNEEYQAERRKVIAQCAYDLVNHTLWHTTPAAGSTIKKYRGMTIEQIAQAVPDLTEWPKQVKSETTHDS